MRSRRGSAKGKWLVGGIAAAILIGIAIGAASWLQHLRTEGASGAGASEPSVPVVNEEASYESIHLAAVGDIMFHNAQLESARVATGGYDFKPVFEQVKPIIEAADIAIANFETTTAGTDPYKHQGYPRFNSPDEAVDALKEAGFDILTTANNHSLDTGKQGVTRTLDTIQSRGLATVGTYATRPDTRVLLKEVKGIKLAFLSYTESLNGLESLMTPEELDAMVNKVDEAKIQEDVAYAKAQGADLILASLHWGNEYEREPSTGQVNLAQRLSSFGVDIILGSHPHVIQKSEWQQSGDRNTFVVYSMGNFISNQRQETLDNVFTEDGVIVQFEIRKDKQTGATEIHKVDYVPTWVYRDMEPGQQTFAYRILPAEDYSNSLELSDAFKARIERSYQDTMSQMDVSDKNDES
ncbi:CapA family protein [Paenibacillus sp. 1011MAR3C5]|uniref:CapA family protein n=1 Tax=Paenibacillus sp. 1011MAR3C5 TaxID=1675787 RepID=UPI000E6BC997|nr:CapA family protein [Paenibacillus sp. 1011MAR3C5]RJE88441.1 CapA family protein [Paenibacillus sp. 1011MAR3C5]